MPKIAANPWNPLALSQSYLAGQARYADDPAVIRPKCQYSVLSPLDLLRTVCIIVPLEPGKRGPNEEECSVRFVGMPGYLTREPAKPLRCR